MVDFAYDLQLQYLYFNFSNLDRKYHKSENSNVMAIGSCKV